MARAEKERERIKDRKPQSKRVSEQEMPRASGWAKSDIRTRDRDREKTERNRTESDR